MPATPELLDQIIDLIEDGNSYPEVAQIVGVSLKTVKRYLTADDDIKARAAIARMQSAEAWLDKGVEVLQSALSKSGDIDASAAKSLAQEYARRAAIRNPQYRDKQDVSLANPDGSALSTTIVINGVPAKREDGG
ncbi:MAG: helix-turn-helix domain-containing protein [Casimicrobium sp.]